MLSLTLFVVNTPESTETLPCCNADASGTLTPLRLWRPSGLPTRARNHHRSRQAWSTVRFDGHLRPYLWPCAQLRASTNERIRSGYIDFPHTVPLHELCIIWHDSKPCQLCLLTLGYFNLSLT